MARFKKGDVICHPTTTHKKYTVLDEVPDLYGHIVAKDNRGVYCTLLESVFELWREPATFHVVTWTELGEPGWPLPSDALVHRTPPISRGYWRVVSQVPVQ